MAPMNQKQMLRRALELLHEQLALEEDADESELATVLPHDSAEAAHLVARMGITLAEYRSRHGRLVAIEEALERIESGTYGICTECDKRIPKERLKVIPQARYCTRCQSEMEQEG
ncbi:MAG: DnaK suppressor protein [Polyangiales bacterium]|jgi:DnaK suppressor protein